MKTIKCRHCGVSVPIIPVTGKMFFCSNCSLHFFYDLTNSLQNNNQQMSRGGLYFPDNSTNNLYNNKRGVQNDNQQKSKNTRNGIIAVVVVALLIVVFCVPTADNNRFVLEDSKLKVFNSSWDASVHQVERYLKKEYLIDPKSYESIEWSQVNSAPNNSYYKYWVRHKYRAKNSFGGYVVENKIFYMDGQGNVVDTKDVY